MSVQGRQWAGRLCLLAAAAMLGLAGLNAYQPPQAPTQYAALHRTPAPSPTPAPGALDLNQADLAALMTLPRIGEVLAQRILDAREALGGFRYPEDLLEVPGIGEKTLEELRPLI